MLMRGSEPSNVGKELKAHFLQRLSSSPGQRATVHGIVLARCLLFYPLDNTEERVNIFLSSDLSENSQSVSFLSYFPYKCPCRCQSLC